MKDHEARAFAACQHDPEAPASQAAWAILVLRSARRFCKTQNVAPAVFMKTERNILRKYLFFLRHNCRLNGGDLEAILAKVDQDFPDHDTPLNQALTIIREVLPEADEMTLELAKAESTKTARKTLSSASEQANARAMLN